MCNLPSYLECALRPVVDPSGFNIFVSKMKQLSTLVILAISSILMQAQQQAGLERALYTSDGHTGDIKHILGIDQYVVTGSDDGTIKVWNLDGSHRITLPAHMDGVNGMFSANGSLWSFGGDNKLKRWSVESGQLLNQWSIYLGPRAMYYYSETRIFMVSSSNLVGEINPQTGEIQSWGETIDPFRLIVYDDMVIIGAYGTISVYSISRRQLDRELDMIQYDVTEDMVIYNSTLLLARRSYITVYSLPSMNVIREIEWQQAYPRFYLEGQILYSAGTRGLMSLNIETLNINHMLYSLYFNTVTRHLGITFVSQQQSLWRLDDNSLVVWTTEVGTSFMTLVLVNSTRNLYVGTGNGEIWEWSLTSNLHTGRFSIYGYHWFQIWSVFYYQGWIYAHSQGMPLFMIEIETGFQDLFDWVRESCVVIESQDLVVTAHDNSLLKFRSLTTRELVAEVDCRCIYIRDMQEGPDAVYMCTWEGQAQRWTFNGSLIWMSDHLQCYSVSVSSGFVFLAGSDGKLSQLNAQTGSIIRFVWHPYSGGLCSILAVPSFVFVSYCSLDSVIVQYQYNSTSLVFVRNLPGHWNKITQIIRDGNYIITTSLDSSIRRWYIPELAPSVPRIAPAPPPMTVHPVSSNGSMTRTILGPKETEDIVTTEEEVEPGNTSSVTASSPQDLFQISTIAFVVAFVFVIAVSCVCIYYLRQRKIRDYHRKLHSKNTASGSALISLTTLNTTTASQSQNPTDTGQNKTIVTASYGKELSIPAYLELEFGMDFVLGEFITAGGGGSLYECKPTSPALQSRIERYFASMAPTSSTVTRYSIFSGTSSSTKTRTDYSGLIAKCITADNDKSKFLAIEVIPDRLRIGLFQELSLMHLLSSFNHNENSDPDKTRVNVRKKEHFVHLFGFSVHPMTMIMRRYELGDMEQLILWSSKKWHVRYLKSLPTGVTYSKRTIVNLILDLCEALKIMHSLGVAHCDIKPSNILLSYSETQGRIELHGVLADFGIARVVSDDGGIRKVQAFAVSELRGLSAVFAAPEVWFRFRKHIESDSNVWLAGDVYAVAITITILLKRRYPFEKDRANT